VAIEADHYRDERKRLMQHQAIIKMAQDLRGSDLTRFYHDDGTPRHGFMMQANKEYGIRSNGDVPTHLGAVAEAIWLALHRDA
jgi:hypothetical protein